VVILKLLAIFEIHAVDREETSPALWQAIEAILRNREKQKQECIISSVHTYSFHPLERDQGLAPYVIVFAHGGRVDEVQELIASIKKECESLLPSVPPFIVIPFLCSDLATVKY